MTELQIVGFKMFETGYAVCCLKVEDIGTEWDQEKNWIAFYTTKQAAEEAKCYFHFDHMTEFVREGVYAIDY